MPRTLLVSVTAPAGSNQDLCGLYRVPEVDSALSDNAAADSAMEAVSVLTGHAIHAASYSMDVFDQDTKAVVVYSRVEEVIQRMPCEKTAEVLPEWIKAHLAQQKAPSIPLTQLRVTEDTPSL